MSIVEVTSEKKFRDEVERLMKVVLRDIKAESLRKSLISKFVEVLDILDKESDNGQTT